MNHRKSFRIFYLYTDYNLRRYPHILTDYNLRRRAHNLTCSVFLGRGHVSLSVLSVPRRGHLSLSLTSFMTPSSLSDEFTPTKDVPLTYDPRTMIILLESYSSSRVTVFITTQIRSLMTHKNTHHETVCFNQVPPLHFIVSFG